MNANKPTKKQIILLKFISDFTDKNAFSPSYREIMRALNLSSVSAVAEHIENCVAKGFLKKVPKSPRSLEVLLDNDEPEYAKQIKKAMRTLMKEKRPEDVDLLKKALKLLEKTDFNH